MSLLQALVLGAIQGLTELLPISSSGHLIIIPKLLGWEAHSLSFDTTLHLGTALALIVYFRKDLFTILVKVIQRDRKYVRLALYLVVGSIPAGLAGVFFGDYLEEHFRLLSHVLIFTILGTLLLTGAETLSKAKYTEILQIGWLRSLYIGFFQALALFPGVSRSGATISGGMLLGLERKEAVRYSFLLSIPIVCAAGLLKLKDLSLVDGGVSFLVLAVGLLSSFVFGYLAILILMKLIQKHTFKIFIIYRVILILVLLVFLFYK